MLIAAGVLRIGTLLKYIPQPVMPPRPTSARERARLLPVWRMHCFCCYSPWALRQMIERCRRNGTRVILSGLRRQPSEILAQMGLQADGHALQFAENFSAAIQLAATSAKVS
jgi:MFS superfamily sulfate permease-like transporter